ncbi:DUF4202 domain-containing protein [Methylocystis sp. JAN1]|uniref:DUF4202 domain-containing protein n=1 Tax=Methylocystis sp. JAN1 TaxID=3397211 RepID=UPI003FA2860D
MPSLEAALAAIDAANAEDPRKIDGRAFESLYAERMSARLAALYPDASDLLKIAARAQHLKRWEVPRGDYPEGRKGYNGWRRACRVHHARLAGEIMRASGYDDASVAHVGALIRKEQLKKDPESQALENVAAVVFLEYYFDGFLAKYADYDDEKIVDILGKTLCKMSPRGHAAALALPLPDRARALVAAAVAREAAALERLSAASPD